MKGLARLTEPVFDFLKDKDFLKDYILMGGTALSLQIHHRLSEDLDFGKWQDKPGLQNKEVEWPKIEKALKEFGKVETEIIDMNQVIFRLSGVKIEFYSNALASSREIQSNKLNGNIHSADVLSLGTMKLELLSRRHIFRDYYDIYSILQEGVSLKELVERCGRYSKHRMKSKNILAILADHSRFEYEEDFMLLEPQYAVRSEEIGLFFRDKIKDEFGR